MENTPTSIPYIDIKNNVQPFKRNTPSLKHNSYIQLATKIIFNRKYQSTSLHIFVMASKKILPSSFTKIYIFQQHYAIIHLNIHTSTPKSNQERISQSSNRDTLDSWYLSNRNSSTPKLRNVSKFNKKKKRNSEDTSNTYEME